MCLRSFKDRSGILSVPRKKPKPKQVHLSSKTDTLPFPPKSHPTRAPEAEDFPLAFFFAALFFLCGADQFFTFRFFGLNFRSGQLFLLAAVLFLLFRGFHRTGGISSGERNDLKISLLWLPFFLVYLLAAISNPSPLRTLVKWGWALFNIGGTTLVLFTCPGWNGGQKKGMFYGIWAVALVIWVQFIAIYWFGACDSATPATAGGQSSAIPGFGGFLGFTQLAGLEQDVMIFRPNAFYYEPSYAGC